MLPFSRVSIIGLGLIGSSIARAVRQSMPTVRLTGHDASAAVREVARRTGSLQRRALSSASFGGSNLSLPSLDRVR